MSAVPRAKRVCMVRGPARVVVHGRCEVLGMDVSGHTISVRPGKSLPFEPRSQCRLRVKSGRGSRKWWADASSAGTSMWRTAVSDVLSLLQNFRNPLVVMVAGGTDVGKSTFCKYLANRAIADGVTTTIIDGDIGQSDLAPPSVIGAAALGHQILDLRDINATVFEFVGSTSPRGLESFISQRLGSIVTRPSFRADLCIVNTDGYVDNGGVMYKKMIATKMQPGIIVLLGKNLVLHDSLASGPWEILQARASSQAQKSRSVRMWRRQDQFARYIGSGRLMIDPSTITFVFRGEGYIFSQLQTMTTLPFHLEQMKGMFVGLGSGGDIAGFGVIDSMTQETLVVMTDIRNFDTVYLSDVRLV